MARFGELIPHDPELCQCSYINVTFCPCPCDSCDGEWDPFPEDDDDESAEVQAFVDAELRKAAHEAAAAVREKFRKDFPPGFVPKGILGESS
mgnify:CR=1 FL=1|jgi:hypothetical protein